MTVQQLRSIVENTYPQHTQYITQQVKKSALHHAVLFTGIRGGGHYLLAEYAAAALLGLNDTSTVEKIHIDLHRLDPQKSSKTIITLDEARNVRKHLKGTPSVAQHTVALLHDADLLNVQAANALLKIVEEPPQNSFIVMSSASEHLLPRTLRSRIQTIRVPVLSHDSVATLASQYKQSHEAVEQIVHLASGRLGIAVDMLLNASEERSSYEWWRQQITFWLQYMQSSIAERVELVAKRYPKEGDSGQTLAIDLDIIQMIFHDLLLLQHGIEGARTVRIDETALQLLQSRYTVAEIERRLELIEELRAMDAARVNTKRIVDYITTAL